MRSLICLALVALASTVSAGSIRPAAIVTSATEDTGLKVFVRDLVNAPTCLRLNLLKGCSDAEAKAKDPTATIYPLTAAGYQDYSTTIYSSMVHDHAKQGATIKSAKGLPDAYLAATPSVQAQVDALLGIVTP